MKYIFRDENGAFDLTKYEDYLDREREAFVGLIQGPELLLIDRFVPTGPESFHDARFERLVATTCASEHEGGEAHTTQLELRLKGPYFDRHFALRYDGVVSCSLEMPGPEDDLLMHEVRSEEGLLVHELRFDKEKAVEVKCRRIHFSEELAVDEPSQE
ncbi:MAG: hypothetical protein MJE77_34545 [Proteobacteria bacterium]|nr:hypothetical protein [Pseudomonadota bacterium]